MDKLDLQILKELMKNSRISITTLSKKVRASREVVNYRINNLKKGKVILSFVSEIDFGKLGFLEASLFLNLKKEGDGDFKKFVNDSDFLAWSSEFSGVWNFGVGIYGKSVEEINKRFLEVYGVFKDQISDYKVMLHSKSWHFSDKYLGVKVKEAVCKKIAYSIDEKDKLILKHIATDSRIDSVCLSGKVGLSAPAVSNRLRMLEKSGIITKYSVLLDPYKLGFYQYSVFIDNRDVNLRTEFLSYLKNHPKVYFLIEYLGESSLEVGVILKDAYELRKVLQEFEGAFAGNRINEVFLIQKDILSISPPSCVFR